MTEDPNQIEIGKFSVCMDVDDEGNLQIRVYPQDKKGQLWDAPIDILDVAKADVDALNGDHELISAKGDAA